jgi:hypothetical protein
VKSFRFLRIIKFAILAAAAVAIAGFIVMQLWNWLIPGLFGGPALHFAQAVGLLVLARLLVGRFGGGHGRRMGWRNRMRGNWQGMSAEERQKLRETMSRRCGAGESRDSGRE